MRTVPLLAALCLAAAAAPARAQDRPARRAPAASQPIGLTVSADIGGGGALGAGTQYTPSGIFESEVVIGYAVGMGLAPELGLLLGLAPGTYVGLRPGIHWSLPSTPFYARLALDLATTKSYLHARWLLLGGGGEIRFTDVVGGYAELDTGIQLAQGAGVPILVRAGVFFSF